MINVEAAPAKENIINSDTSNVLYVKRYKTHDMWNEKQNGHSNSLNINGCKRINAFRGTFKM